MAFNLAPGDADVPRALGLAEGQLGQYERSLDHLRRSRSLSLAATLLALRRL
jgi:hypothetical protein